jgi:hypothetical protein
MAFRPPHILLFSPGFVEIRHAPTGILVQVIEGYEIQNVKTDVEDKGGVLVAMRGGKDDASGQSYKLLEFQETVPLTATPSGQSEDVWDEWHY